MNRLLRHLLIVFVLLDAIPFYAQAPYQFSYQAVVRDNNNKLIRNSAVGLRISILKTSATGPVLFQETHTPLTNDNGLFSVVIGDGTIVLGGISNIDWGNDIFFLKSEIDPLGLANYTLTAIQQLVSVPYALHCNEYQSLEDVVKRNNMVGGCQLKDVKNPTDPQDAVTKYYFDSVLQNLAIYMSQPKRDTIATVCDILNWRGKVYTMSGRYKHAIKNAGCGGSCDSIITLYLTVLNGSHKHYFDTACTASYVWLANGSKGHGTGSDYTVAGKYAGAEYTNEDNCPSFDTLHLAFGTATQSVDTRSDCGSLTWLDGNTYTSDNTTSVYNTGKHNTQGCDSSVRLDLTILDVSDIVDNQEIVEGGSLTWYGNSYDAEQTDGSVRHQFVDANGCTRDSVLNLTVISPCASIVTPIISGTATICPNDSTTLSVSNSQSGYTYYWCNESTGTSVSVSSAGSYNCYAITSSPVCTTEVSNTVVTSLVSFSPSLSISPSSKTATLNEEVAISLSANNDGGTNSGYSWSRKPTTNCILTSGQNASQQTFKATAVGTYTVSAAATFTKNSCSINDTVTCTITVSEPEPEAPDGCLPKTFSVSSTKKVFIATGNLEFYSFTNKFQLALKQYSVVGNADGNNKSALGLPIDIINARKDNAKWIDLFPSGTSELPIESPNNGYFPYGVPEENPPTGVIGIESMSKGRCRVVDQGGASDWGSKDIYSQHGDFIVGSGWQTLTGDEVKYLLNITTSTVRANKAGTGCIKIGSTYHYGLIILPDNFVDPKSAGPSGDQPFTPCNSSKADELSETSNYYSSEENWNKMEAAGAAFLPCPGYSYEATMEVIKVYEDNNSSSPSGNYWLAGGAMLYFNGKGNYSAGTSSTNSPGVFSYSDKLFYRFAVRLVKPVE